ncbi:tRNA glutamyl-Q(34) synthetase GluQRS [Puniceibacterium sp. IMCC21224]|uniref:tRNA glutamyl-Q(34) synthetase GluQRS n=1 Tax=Puniceibacterium sp. IMCC21224 TaxID=1618204 RepID=UPI00064DDE16|nr:tRNA glutamyl-Q(34) synthetase GluQRS [Puniceibacterium sp. IMCC21224]KMK67372.1 tRNA synthetases class I (E and Q), catalytic domain [Puniceibacterium sp. IMCC21224]
MVTFTTRFAPSPTGPLHLGHAYSALLAHDMSRAAGGQFLLRIEDIDQTRCKPEWEQKIIDDLSWLGVRWDAPPLRQFDRLTAYQAALDQLWSRGLLYPCACTRRDITAAASAPQEGAEPLIGPDGLVYPGTCRPENGPIQGPRPDNIALRLNMARAMEAIPEITFVETGQCTMGHSDKITVAAQEMIQTVGDVVLSRRDFPGSYHLSVVLDDAAQGVTEVIRGKDLFEATKIHILLQILMRIPSPVYHHHRLIRDSNGKRLAKRDDARAIATFRAEGKGPDDIRAMVGL